MTMIQYYPFEGRISLSRSHPNATWEVSSHSFQIFRESHIVELLCGKMIGNELAAFLARVLFTKQMPSVGCRGDVHWWPKVLTAHLVRFSASLQYNRRARATLARLWPCKPCFFSYPALLRQDSYNSCLVACSLSLSRDRMCARSRTHKLGPRSVSQELGPTGLFACR